LREVTVIIPTRALAPRTELIRGAIRSVLDQDRVRATPLVVVNGSGADPWLIRELREDSRVVLAFLDRANLPAALRWGRERVRTPFFTTLDDDDELLPGGLLARLTALETNRNWDAVVTNGIVRKGEVQAIKNPDTDLIRRDPVRAMLKHNWLLPGAWLSRTGAMPPEVFDGMPEFLECTYLAYWMASNRRIGFLETPTLLRVKDTPASASRSMEYTLGQADALRRLLQLNLPPDVKANIERRISSVCHTAARRCLADGSYADAWSWHLRSLREPGGWRFIRYTARLLAAPLGLGR
jgi:glycosyltransferase involved in cell wall biosynthesis